MLVGSFKLRGAGRGGGGGGVLRAGLLELLVMLPLGAILSTLLLFVVPLFEVKPLRVLLLPLFDV